MGSISKISVQPKFSSQRPHCQMGAFSHQQQQTVFWWVSLVTLPTARSIQPPAAPPSPNRKPTDSFTWKMPRECEIFTPIPSLTLTAIQLIGQQPQTPTHEDLQVTEMDNIRDGVLTRMKILPHIQVRQK